MLFDLGENAAECVDFFLDCDDIYNVMMKSHNYDVHLHDMSTYM
jgi:hypothetical protein